MSLGACTPPPPPPPPKSRKQLGNRRGCYLGDMVITQGDTVITQGDKAITRVITVYVEDGGRRCGNFQLYYHSCSIRSARC